MYTYIELINSPANEVKIREYLINKCDTLRLTRKSEWCYGFFTQGKIFSRVKDGDENNPKYKNLEQLISPNILRIQEDSQEYPGIGQDKNTYLHYYLKLDSKIMNMLNNSTLLWQFFEDTWYGFENPAFISEGKVIACVVSHELSVYVDETVKSFDLKNIN